jgi:putative nucleotidyltransferase with HDIG domain
VIVAADPSILERVLKHVRDGGPGIPAVPAVANQVRQLAGNDHAGAREIAAVVGHDQVLAASLLRYGNSAMYRGLKPVQDLQTAVARLGVKMVMAAMMAELSRSLYRFEDQEDGELFAVFWKHSVACAEVCRKVARLVRYAEPEQSFMAGLVHDIGKVATLTSLAHLRSRGDLTWPRDVILEFMNETHAMVGSELLKRWKLPPEICEIVRDHHQELSPSSGGVPVAILQFSDLACAKLGYAQTPIPDASLLAEPSATILRLTDLGIASLLVDLEDSLPEVTRDI